MGPIRPRVLISQPIPASALDRLRTMAEVEMGEDSGRIMSRAELLERVRRAECLFHLMHDAVDAEVIAAGTNLRVIASMSIVPATVDVAAATARRIPVTTIPPIVTEATADLHWALLLAVARRVVEADGALRRGVFPGSQSLHFAGAAIHGKTLGIVGLGRIGRAVARRARGFDMTVLYTKRSRLAEAEEQGLGVTYVALDDLLRRSDFVSLNAAFTRETFHLIGARELSLMKPTAFVVNTARGPMVDEAALAAALRSRRIAGAGLDVFEEEPRVHPDLLSLDRVVLTPHLGSAVGELRETMAHIVVDNILAVIKGERPPNLYNAEVYA
ncbi:MAG TPA: D-glycerate dehydrogenase [Candidatus Methylomirabilis sp.]|nr:D-glycerate dehydrogenase [Candidatus Methylomirabilis sp.]